MTKLNEFIMTKLLANGSGEVDKAQYDVVIQFLDTHHRSAICNYVLLCARGECIKINGSIKSAQVLDLMDTNFCVQAAFQYISFLQNSHEYIEYEGRRP